MVGLGLIFITGIKSYFNFSFLIPTSFKHVIQDYTPFLQTKEFYALHDNTNNLNWVVNVLNKKYVEILIKTKGFSCYVPAFEYISNLQKNADVIILKDLNNTETVFKSSISSIKTIDRITLQTDRPADLNDSSDAVNAAVDRIMALIS